MEKKKAKTTPWGYAALESLPFHGATGEKWAATIFQAPNVERRVKTLDFDLCAISSWISAWGARPVYFSTPNSKVHSN